MRHTTFGTRIPERPLRNVEIRTQRVGEQAKATPEKSAVIKPRSVQLGVEAAKLEAKLYLADQYTNKNGQMICQACKGELPFKLPNGSYYFEAVEIVRGAPKRFREGFLALCPNHAAAYQHANAQCTSFRTARSPAFNRWASTASWTRVTTVGVRTARSKLTLPLRSASALSLSRSQLPPSWPALPQ